MKKLKFLFVIIIAFTLFLFNAFNVNTTYAQMPYYNLSPKNITLRSSFTTEFTNSTLERKHNIKLASKKINKYFLDVGAEFSFNKTVGLRTLENGFLEAKIISNGKFTNGVGGGVCQVSTTLYNAVLLADLKITEFHPHSLPVSYVLPSFDAMVNSYTADLRFINNTKNPIIIYTFCSEKSLTVKIFGEQKDYLIERESVIKEKVLNTETEYVLDVNDEYNLEKGEEKIISYGSNGLKSQGYIIKRKNGKIISKKLIRNDFYKPTKKIIATTNVEKINN